LSKQPADRSARHSKPAAGRSRHATAKS
jgi:hypothetical protein